VSDSWHRGRGERVEKEWDGVGECAKRNRKVDKMALK